MDEIMDNSLIKTWAVRFETCCARSRAARLLGLAILGILISRPKRFFDHYIEIFLGLSSLVFLVGDSTIKSRVFYNFPIGFLAAYGFLSVYRREDKTFRWLFGYFVASAMLAYLFRGLANIM